MDIQVMIPSSTSLLDFNFDSASTSPYISAPSSPQRFNGFYYSAPTSPNRVSSVFYGMDDTATATSSSVPFGWEDKPGIPKSTTSSNYGDAEEDLDKNSDDFAFDFSGQFETKSLHADELFDGGKIKPLKPPPRFEYNNSFNKPRSHESPRSPKKIIQEAFSRKKNHFDPDPFQTALEIQTRKENFITTSTTRGRSEKITTKPSHSRHKSTSARSVSPLRVSDLLLDQEKNQPSPDSNTSSLFPSFWYKKWKIKDLLLFRSASESRASDNDEQMKKYATLRKAATIDGDVKNSSFRSTDSGSVGSVSSRRRSGPPISAHEWHYTVNRAVSEEMKKRTSLPYKQGLLGCLGFHPSVPAMSRGSGSNGRLNN